jgi:deoxyribose-phosphate aldolase
MSATIPSTVPGNAPSQIPIGASDLDFDYGTFDSAAFTAQALANRQSLAAVIDHSLLDPGATRRQVESLCAEAAQFHFASVVVHPVWVSTAVNSLAGAGVPVAAVIGFPHGASLISTLRHEAEALTLLGARELDMVLPLGQLRSGNYDTVEHTIRAAVPVAHRNHALLTVTLETGALAVDEKLRAAEIAIQAGADFLKTSTGLSTGGATVADAALLRGVAGARCGIKAAGGIRTLADVRSALEAGANRIGSSASVAILSELKDRE